MHAVHFANTIAEVIFPPNFAQVHSVAVCSISAIWYVCVCVGISLGRKRRDAPSFIVAILTWIKSYIAALV